MDSLPEEETFEGKEALFCELKSDLKWSDGASITVEDIAFTIDFYKKIRGRDLKIYPIVSETIVKKVDDRSFYLISSVKNFHYLAK